MESLEEMKLFTLNVNQSGHPTTSLMDTTWGTDTFNTGVDEVVARQSSCHCHFSLKSQFFSVIKLLHISGFGWSRGSAQQHHVLASTHLDQVVQVACSFVVAGMCQIYSSSCLFLWCVFLFSFMLFYRYTNYVTISVTGTSAV
jgi:hypothetical protein